EGGGRGGGGGWGGERGRGFPPPGGAGGGEHLGAEKKTWATPTPIMNKIASKTPRGKARGKERDELPPTRGQGLRPPAFQGHLGGGADAVCAQPGARRGGPAQEPAPLGRRSRHRRRFRLRQARRVLLHVGRRAQAQLRHRGRG